jgi:hypothetical protein
MGEVIHIGFMAMLLFAVIGLLVIGLVDQPLFNAITGLLRDLVKSAQGQIVEFTPL